ncbi:UTP--glucose-1-phosphate uridylyltransferase GalU [Kiloniella sp. b19]|uniref:UTP--glucose-1-phosphate uridylyltransferase GalU n=1 Tax=Kiloniella sp. GXU_MW_B19 TaxID=3141326 RepID=UPI0031DE5D83
MSQRVRKAVFPVGGLGTRFLPATKAMPKEMLPVVDKPLIQYAVDEAREAGIEEMIFVTGRGKTAIENHFDRDIELEQVLKSRGKTAELDDLQALMLDAGNVIYTRQQEAIGLGHAVWCARHWIGDEPFAVLLADDLVQAKTGCLKQMIDRYNETGGHLVAVENVPREHTNRYGVLDVVETKGNLVKARDLVEKPDPAVAPSTMSIIGRYILDPSVIKELDRHDVGAGGEIQLTDAMARTLDRVDFHGLQFDGTRFDCGSKRGFLEATISFALERPDLSDAMQDIVNRYAK